MWVFFNMASTPTMSIRPLAGSREQGEQNMLSYQGKRILFTPYLLDLSATSGIVDLTLLLNWTLPLVLHLLFLPHFLCWFLLFC